jgi:hypothetical protein
MLVIGKKASPTANVELANCPLPLKVYWTSKGANRTSWTPSNPGALGTFKWPGYPLGWANYGTTGPCINTGQSTDVNFAGTPWAYNGTCARITGGKGGQIMRSPEGAAIDGPYWPETQVVDPACCVDYLELPPIAPTLTEPGFAGGRVDYNARAVAAGLMESNCYPLATKAGNGPPDPGCSYKLPGNITINDDTKNWTQLGQSLNPVMNLNQTNTDQNFNNSCMKMMKIISSGDYDIAPTYGTSLPGPMANQGAFPSYSLGYTPGTQPANVEIFKQ